MQLFFLDLTLLSYTISFSDAWPLVGHCWKLLFWYMWQAQTKEEVVLLLVGQQKPPASLSANQVHGLLLMRRSLFPWLSLSVHQYWKMVAWLATYLQDWHHHLHVFQLLCWNRVGSYEIDGPRSSARGKKGSRYSACLFSSSLLVIVFFGVAHHLSPPDRASNITHRIQLGAWH